MKHLEQINGNWTIVNSNNMTSKRKSKNSKDYEVIKKLYKKFEKNNFQNNLFISDKKPDFRIMGLGTYREEYAVSIFINKYFQDKMPTMTNICSDFDLIKFISKKIDEIEVLYFCSSDSVFEGIVERNSITTIVKFENLILFISDSISNDGSYEVQHWYLDYSNIDNVEKVYKEISSKQYKYVNKNLNKVHIVCLSDNRYFLQPFDISKVNKNIIENYNDDFKEIDKIIRESLKKKKKGVVLLHGKKGTGKSNYIRFLIKNLKSNKKFIYIPSHLSRNISETNFITFLSSKCKDSILILEDVEDILLSRESKLQSSGVIADLLNMSDGLMSDSLNVQFICSFNTEMKNIDEALTRPGRLIAEYYFDELTEEKAAEVYKRLGKKTGTSRILCDIYNDAPLRTPKKENKIGFVVK